jgi:hypothetical protein
MQIDPIAERQRITDLYRRMFDDELLNLAADSRDLTEIARDVLEDELKRRRLGALSNAGPQQNTTPEPRLERRGTLLGNQGGASQIVLDYRSMRMGEAPLEYTWKTQLCDCESMDEARLLCDVLRRAGIDNWIDDRGTDIRGKGLEFLRPRVMVAADQLDQARATMTDPIPKEAIADAKIKAPEFEMPRCPECGATDPALEGVNPFNSWRCEACGNQWAEPEPSNPASGV